MGAAGTRIHGGHGALSRASRMDLRDPPAAEPGKTPRRSTILTRWRNPHGSALTQSALRH